MEKSVVSEKAKVNWEHMVVGFVFDEGYNHVVLIEKNRPNWQRGLLNGVGGHMEPHESFKDAMIREFHEEAGVKVPGFKQYINLVGKNWTVCFFEAVIEDLSIVQSMTDEKIIIERADSLPRSVIPNLRWLIPMAMDKSLIRPQLIHCRQ